MMNALLWIVCGYLLGSIPFAYLAGLLLGGIDIRRIGSHTVGGSNVYENVSKPAVVIVGILDMSKAGLAYWLGMKLGWGLIVSLGAGLAAVVGHNWPIYLRFHGGRGLSACMGVLIMAFPLGFFWTLLMTTFGWLFQNPALTLVGFITLPALSHFTNQPRPISLASLLMLVLIIIKRLEANRAPLPPMPERWRVLSRRLLLDRDIEDWQAWAHRQSE